MATKKELKNEIVRLKRAVQEATHMADGRLELARETYRKAEAIHDFYNTNSPDGHEVRLLLTSVNGHSVELANVTMWSWSPEHENHPAEYVIHVRQPDGHRQRYHVPTDSLFTIGCHIIGGPDVGAVVPDAPDTGPEDDDSDDDDGGVYRDWTPGMHEAVAAEAAQTRHNDEVIEGLVSMSTEDILREMQPKEDDK